jgi:nitrogen fixation/metabolism regulation signal transduction histidine kinase
LISNGFYAAWKRKEQMKTDAYEPTLTAETRSLGDRVEIRIRDNGTGIPRDVKDKMFNPFFTTKPPGEGTGLGLSICYDIIVKQHAGSIEVDTQPGKFTEFRITLPRTGHCMSPFVAHRVTSLRRANSVAIRGTADIVRARADLSVPANATYRQP